MFEWLTGERRRRIRRESDQQLRMKEAIENKKEAARAALAKMNQWHEKRYHDIPVVFPDRRNA